MGLQVNIPTVLRKFFRPQKSPAHAALEEFLVERKKPEIKAELEPVSAHPRHPNRVSNRTFKADNKMK